MTILRDRVDGLRNFLASRKPETAVARACALLAMDRPQAAAKLLGIAAQAGLPAAQYELGLCYLLGKAVPPDAGQAVHWLNLAARQDFTAAQVKLAGLLLYGVPAGGEADTGLFTRQAARPVQDFGEAARWARRAALAGAPEGMALLGFILAAGPAELRDPDEAKFWYARAAALGNAQGQLGHGLILLEQAASSEDADAARAEILKAAQAGLAQAHDCLGSIYEAGSAFTAQDLPLAAAHYREAAQAGLTHAMARYGLALLDGRGVQADVVAGETWARRAALAGDAQAATRLGRLYAATDRALPPNDLEAARWFQLAAQAGSAEAANAMGKMYLLGKGVPRDTGEALAWFSRAAAQTNEQP